MYLTQALRTEMNNLVVSYARHSSW
jgi:hypothetical protein